MAKVPLPESMSIPAAGRYYLGLGKNASYDAVELGLLPVIPVGKKKKKVPTRIMERRMDAGLVVLPTAPAPTIPVGKKQRFDTAPARCKRGKAV
jgi:hypothetical protein